MPTSLAAVDVANSALSKIGCQTINSLLDTGNQSAIYCNLNFQLAYLEVSRATRWNCILETAVLAQEPQTAIPGTGQAIPPQSAPWAPNTSYTAGQYLSSAGVYYFVLKNYVSSSSVTTDVNNGNLQVYNTNGPSPVNAVPWSPNTQYLVGTFLTYGGYYYQVMFSYTSSTNFQTDLGLGALTQTNLPTNDPFFPGGCWGGGSEYPSGWAYAYALPSDFVLMASLNAHVCSWGWNGGDDGDDYEIIGPSLFCNEAQAVIQYVQNTPDTTRFDAMMMNCITLKLASMIATPLRQDGGRMEAALLQEYDQALRRARTKNGGEKQSRRFNPITSSRFNQARYGGVNG